MITDETILGGLSLNLSVKNDNRRNMVIVGGCWNMEDSVLPIVYHDCLRQVDSNELRGVI